MPEFDPHSSFYTANRPLLDATVAALRRHSGLELTQHAVYFDQSGIPSITTGLATPNDFQTGLADMDSSRLDDAAADEAAFRRNELLIEEATLARNSLYRAIIHQQFPDYGDKAEVFQQNIIDSVTPAAAIWRDILPHRDRPVIRRLTVIEFGATWVNSEASMFSVQIGLGPVADQVAIGTLDGAPLLPHEEYQNETELTAYGKIARLYEALT